ncbi:MAG: sugar ABC transporter permease, partial [Chloroflexi bacterium]
MSLATSASDIDIHTNGHSSLVTGRSSLVTGHWSLVTRHSSLVTPLAADLLEDA